MNLNTRQLYTAVRTARERERSVIVSFLRRYSTALLNVAGKDDIRINDILGLAEQIDNGMHLPATMGAET